MVRSIGPFANTFMPVNEGLETCTYFSQGQIPDTTLLVAEVNRAKAVMGFLYSDCVPATAVLCSTPTFLYKSLIRGGTKQNLCHYFE